MAYDKACAERVREALKRRKGLSERKMFGGIAFMINGNMCAGILDTDLVLRLGEEGSDAALDEKHTRPMDFTGKPIKTMIYVAASGWKTEAALKAWLNRAVKFARSLPAK